MEADAASGRVRSARIEVLGVPIDALDRRAVLDRLHSRLGNESAGLLHLITLNPEQVMMARANSEFLAAIDAAEMVVCDGIGTLLAVRLARPHSRIERLTGVEIVDVLTAWSAFAEHGGVFLLGGHDADRASRALRSHFPAARICGSWSGGAPDADWDQISCDRIAESGATVLLVGYGAPAQVLWIERNRAALEASGVRIAVGVGGVFDYLSGHATPAPVLVRRAGFEWAWRLAHEPWRWRRQTALLPFAAFAAGEVVRSRWLYRILGGDDTVRNRQESDY